MVKGIPVHPKLQTFRNAAL